MGPGSCLGPYVRCYNVADVCIGEGTTISQYCYLCTATHPVDSLSRELLVEAIVIGNHAWLCTDVFIGPGIQISDYAIAFPRAVVTRNVPVSMIVAGIPAREVRKRNISQATGSEI